MTHTTPTRPDPTRIKAFVSPSRADLTASCCRLVDLTKSKIVQERNARGAHRLDLMR
jgi:hypothetical protein